MGYFKKPLLKLISYLKMEQEEVILIMIMSLTFSF